MYVGGAAVKISFILWCTLICKYKGGIYNNTSTPNKLLQIVYRLIDELVLVA